jgi:hypothetical protein
VAWRALVAQPIGLTADGQYSIIVNYYDDADPANATAGLATGKSGTASASTDLISITSHGFVAGDQVVIAAITGGTGLQVGDLVTVLAAGLTTGVFAVSKAGLNGTAVNITTNATAITVQKYTPPAVVLASAAFNMGLGSSTQDLINEVVRIGGVERSWVQARDGARAAVLVGASTPIP